VVTPPTKCKLRLLKLDCIKDHLLMGEEFVTNHERLKPQEDKNEEDRSKVDDLHGSDRSKGLAPLNPKPPPSPRPRPNPKNLGTKTPASPKHCKTRFENP
jgi:hypothetical protein